MEKGLSNPLLEIIDAELRLKRRKRARRKLAVASAATVFVFATWFYPWLTATRSLNTPPAQRQSLALADGSRLELNARSDATLDFRYGRRVVHLSQGEAFFSVARDAAHPFVVVTPRGSVRVLGTAFNVRVGPEGAPEVTLIEGSVSAELPGGTVALRPGQQLTQEGEKVEAKVLNTLQLEAVTAWREGRIVLEGLSLAEAAARFARHHQKDIRVDPVVAGLRMGGSAPLDDFHGFLDSLPDMIPVRILAQGRETFAIVPK